MRFVKPYTWEIILTIIIGIVKFAIPLFIPLLIKIVLDDIIAADDLTDVEKTKELLLAGWNYYCVLYYPSTY